MSLYILPIIVHNPLSTTLIYYKEAEEVAYALIKNVEDRDDEATMLKDIRVKAMESFKNKTKSENL